MDIEKLKKQLDDQVQKITEEHGQKFAEETCSNYRDAMEPDDLMLMDAVFRMLIECKQEDFYRLWYPIVDLCMIKNYKLYNHVDRSLGYVDGVVRRTQPGGAVNG